MTSARPTLPPAGAAGVIGSLGGAEDRLVRLLQEARQKLESERQRRSEPIAIVGMACRLPGGASSPDALWALLRSRVDATSDVPVDRWDAEALYDPDPDAPGKAYTRRGAFLEHVDGFDPKVFGISPREALGLDPQQRLLLEVTWEALENASISTDSLNGSATGVWVGLCGDDYARRSVNSGVLELVDPYNVLGNARSVAAGRIASVFGLQGPVLQLDTACSSSLVALHLTVRSLRAGECSLALVGGVNLMLSPEMTIALCKLNTLAKDGRCKTFDADADGFGRGEGCGMVVLKRLSDARAAGDRIAAVIRGTAVNHGGRGNGLMAASAAAQESVIRAALADASVEPQDVGYVEAHGTGTLLGDSTEVLALAGVFAAPGSREKPLMLGSIKTNVGHLEGAAGIAGVIKAALCLAHGRIPPHLHLRRPNPRVSWHELPVKVVTDEQEWAPSLGMRVAGVSSFGITGTNAHVVLEQSPTVEVPAPAPERSAELIVVSASTPAALRAQLLRLADHLDSHPEHGLEDVAYSLLTSRPALEHRWAAAVGSRGALLDALRGDASGEEVARFVRRPLAEPKVAFVFPGPDSRWFGLGWRLLEEEAAFRDAIQACDAAIRAEAGWSILDEAPALPGRSESDRVEVLAPLSFSLQVALAALWQAWGVKPDVVVGHGLGEVAAGYVSGALSLADAAAIVCRSSSLLGRSRSQGESALTEPLLEELVRALRGVAPRSGAVAMHSAVSGRLLTGAELTARYWADSLRQPARFEDSGRWLIEKRFTHIVEVSAHPALTDALEDIRAELAAPGVVTGSLRRGCPERLQLLESLGALYRQGHPLAARALFRERARRVTLPNYPWQRERYWLPQPFGAPRPRAASHALLGVRSSSPIADAIFESALSLRGLPWLGEHRLGGEAVLPASALMELLRMAGEEHRAGAACELSGLVIQSPLVVEDANARLLQVVLSDEGKHAAVYGRPARDAAAAGWTLYASATIEAARGLPVEPLDVQAVRARCARPIDLDRFYSSCAAVGLDYGPAFRGLRALRAGGREALAEIELGPGLDGGSFGLHPALLGSALQAAFGVLEVGLEPPPWLPVSIQRYALHRLGATSLLAHAQVGGASPGEGCLVDVTLAEPDGSVVGRVSGLRLRRMTPAASAPALVGPVQVQYRVEWLPTPLPARARALTGRWLVVGTSDGEEALVSDLRAAGADARAVDVWPSKDEAADEVLCLFDMTGDAEGAMRAALRALDVVHRVLGRERAPRIHWVTRAAVAVSSSDEVAVAGSSVWGFARTLARERPELSCRLLDLEPGAGLLEVLLHEVDGRDREDQIAWRGGRRYVARLTRAEGSLEVPASESDPLEAARSGMREARSRAPLEPCSHEHGTVLVTGGLGALGAEVARVLARRGTRHLLLMGRRGLEAPGAAELVKELDALGARATVVAGDVAVQAEVEKAMTLIPPGAPLLGVVHAAASFDDGSLEEQTAERLTAVMAPKVRGAWHLHTLTRGATLDFFVFFSSLAGTLGGPGQAPDAAASSFLDALAVHRRALGLPAASLAGGAWQEGVSVEGRAALAAPLTAPRSSGGIEPLALAQVRALFERSLDRPEAHLILASRDLLERAKTVGGSVPSIWRALLRSGPKPAASSGEVAEASLGSRMGRELPDTLHLHPTADASARYSSARAVERLGSSSPAHGEVARCDCLNPLAAPRARLFGFHDAGGSATRFVPFCRLGNDGVEIHTVAHTRGALADGTGEHYLAQVVGYIRARSELPYVLFGHSLGGLFAWRVLKALQRADVRLPRLLVLSAAATPAALERARSTEGLSELFSRVGGDRLRGLKSLRADFEADFALWWALPAADGAPVAVEILAFAGRDDVVAGAQAMRAWQQATTAGFSLSELPGGHFYIIAEAGRAAMLDALGEKLRQL